MIRRKGRYAVVDRRQMRTALGIAFGAVAALCIAAVLALPHLQSAEEAAAPVLTEATPTPPPVATASPTPDAKFVFTLDMLDESFEQLTDWRLVLVNSDVPLPEDYEMKPSLYSNVEINSNMYDPLRDMLEAAANAGLSLWVASSYRSVEAQEQVLSSAVENRMNSYGMSNDEAYENALLTIQKPGYSEHHTGLAVDFNYVTRDFEQTKEYEWLMQNAASYGFVQRYPRDKEDITGISFEAWHYRYVGREHAAVMTAQNMCLEEYIVYLMNS